MTTRETNIETRRALFVPGVFLASISLAYIDLHMAKYAWLLTIPLNFLIRMKGTKTEA